MPLQEITSRALNEDSRDARPPAAETWRDGPRKKKKKKECTDKIEVPVQIC